MQTGGKGDQNSSNQSSQGRQGKPNPSPPVYFGSQDSSNLRSIDQGGRRNEKPAPVINPFDFIPEFSDDESESNTSPQQPKDDFDPERSLTNGIKATGLPVNPKSIPKVPSQFKAPASTASNSESLANRDRPAPKDTNNQNSGRNAAPAYRPEPDRQLGGRQIEIPASTSRAANEVPSNTKITVPRQQAVDPKKPSSSSNSVQGNARPTMMDEEKQPPPERRIAAGVELPKGPQRQPPKPNRIEAETSVQGSANNNPTKNRAPRKRSSTEARKNRGSAGSNQQSFADAPHLGVGESIPRAQFERILIDISKDFRGEAKKGLYDRIAVGILRSVTEAYLVEQFRRASMITRARGRVTLNRIDLETLTLLDNDPYIRRSNSAPTLTIAGI